MVAMKTALGFLIATAAALAVAAQNASEISWDELVPQGALDLAPPAEVPLDPSISPAPEA